MTDAVVKRLISQQIAQAFSGKTEITSDDIEDLKPVLEGRAENVNLIRTNCSQTKAEQAMPDKFLFEQKFEDYDALMTFLKPKVQT